MQQQAPADPRSHPELPGTALEGIANAILLSAPIWLAIAALCGLI